jgi:quinohemoprotein ethanol dehydrogenase
VDGRQYVTVIAGARFQHPREGGRQWDYRAQQWRVLTFALDGKGALPAAETTPSPYQADPDFRLDPAKARQGAPIYALRCSVCHGDLAMSGGAAPHLLRSPMPLDRDAFTTVIREGALRGGGMPRFPELSDEDIEALQHYLQMRAREEAAKQRESR